MGGRSTFSDTSYKRIAKEVETGGGPATKKGEQRHREGKGLHELVDPKGYGAIRRSYGPFEVKGKKVILKRGVAMLIEHIFDTTSSMGTSVDTLFKVLPKTYGLLARGKKPVLAKYDVQIINAIFGDVVDDYVLCRSQAEMDEEIAKQMTYMVPCRGGGDFTEDPHYGLFGAAYLTDTHVKRYGFKHYHFMATDADSRKSLNIDQLYKVFGSEVFAKVKENGYQITDKNLPDLKQIVTDLLINAHAFVFQVEDNPGVNPFWTRIYGKDRVIMLPRTELFPEVEAAIIGLTEGVLDLQNLEEYLTDDAGLSKADAQAVARAVANIPIGAQAALPNFAKLPVAGDVFAKKGDLWPIGSDETEGSEGAGKGNKEDEKKDEEKIWL